MTDDDELLVRASEDTLTTTDGAIVRRQPGVRYKLGGYAYGAKFGPNCGVCNSDNRIEIERAVVLGVSYRRIRTEFEARGIEVSISSIGHHVRKGHMPLDVTIRRIALEERAEEIGRGLEDYEGTLVDHVGLLQEVQRRTYERMVSGEIEPDVADGVAAAKMLATINRDNNGQQLDWEVMRNAISQMMLVARSFMDDDAWGRYTRSLQSNPVLRAIDASMRQRNEVEATANDL